MADGGIPDSALTLLLTVLIGWIATALADRTRGPLGTLVTLGAGQLALHVVLTELVDHELHGGGIPGPFPGDVMFVAHALATVVTALLLARADALLVVVATGLRRLLPVRWHAMPVPPGPVRPPLALPTGRTLTELLVRRVHGRRAPPCSRG